MFTDPNAPAPSAVAGARKFLFDRSFDPGAIQKPLERKPITLKPDEFDALKKENYEAGFAAGQRAGADDHARKLLAVTERVAVKLDEALALSESLHKQQENDTLRLALAAVRKILPDFTSKHGIGEIEAVLSRTLAEMIHEPRIVVRVHESQFDEVNARIHDITAQKAYAGKIIVLADADVRPNDCKVEWADGGIERNTESTMKDIESILATDGEEKT
ncbi:MAG: FliH/SctL family protein [Bdellovibrionales bacterium]